MNGIETHDVVTWAISVCALLVSLAGVTWNIVSKDRSKVQITVRRGLDMRYPDHPRWSSGIPSLIIEVANVGQKPIGIKFPVVLLMPIEVGVELWDRKQYEGWPEGGRLIEHDKFTVYVHRHTWQFREGSAERHGFEVLVKDFSDGVHLAKVSAEIQRWLDDYHLDR